jgi:IclR helix-turn-helix domain
MPRPTCRVCQSGAASVVDALLTQKVFLRTIAEQTGLTKSSVHRHAQKCFIKAAAKSLRTAKFNPQTDRTLVRFKLDEDVFDVMHDPTGQTTHGETITAAELRARDCVLVVRLENSTIKNPDALLRLAEYP